MAMNLHVRSIETFISKSLEMENTGLYATITGFLRILVMSVFKHPHNFRDPESTRGNP